MKRKYEKPTCKVYGLKSKSQLLQALARFYSETTPQQ